MSRVMIPVAALTVAIFLPFAWAQKEKDKEPVKLPPHVLLHGELLQEEQTLYRLQTEWLLHVVKTKQRLDKTRTDVAKLEADACGKMLAATRELPALFDDAIGRFKQSSLANVPAAEKIMNATGKLAEELQRARRVADQTPAEAFAAERALGASETSVIFALADVADFNESLRALEGIEQGGAPSAVGAVRDLLTKRKRTCQATLDLCKDLPQHPKHGKLLASLAQQIAPPISAVLADKGLLGVAEASLDTLEKSLSPKGGDADAAARARQDIRNVQAGFEPLREATSRLTVIGGLGELAQRQQRLHDRLKKQRDAVLARLLEGIE